MDELLTQSRHRANILHASAAWGSDGDAILLEALCAEVERLTRIVAMDTLLQIDGELHDPCDGAAAGGRKGARA